MLAYIAEACPICRRFDRHAAVFALWRALLSAGSRIEISSAMMPITTSSSTSVKARVTRARLRMRLDMMQFLLVGARNAGRGFSQAGARNVKGFAKICIPTGTSVLQSTCPFLQWAAMHSLGVPLTLADLAPSPRAAWAPVVLLIVIGVGFAIGNIVLSVIIGPRRTGPGK